MATLQELLDQKAALDRQIAEVKNSTRAQAVDQIKKLMAENGLTTADLAASPPTVKKKVGAPKGKVAAKYRDPKTGSTWSGRGLKPKWLAGELAGGKSLSDFAV